MIQRGYSREQTLNDDTRQLEERTGRRKDPDIDIKKDSEGGGILTRRRGKRRLRVIIVFSPCNTDKLDWYIYRTFLSCLNGSVEASHLKLRGILTQYRTIFLRKWKFWLQF